MRPTVSNLLRVLRGQLGYHETGGPHGDDGNITKYGAAYGVNGYAWCAIFAWWVFKQLGIDVREQVSQYFAGVVYAVQGWRAKGWFHDGIAGLRPGDELYFDWPGEDSVDHTGFCEFVDRNGVHTIEGNTEPGTAVSDPNGGGVYRRLRQASDIVGYARHPGVRYDLGTRIKQAAKKVVTKKYPLLRRGNGAHVLGGDKRVKRVQRLLTKGGFYRGPIDGDFGPKTEAAVRAFQQAKHLHVDGQAGPKTLATLRY